jgi:hypothetical protein
MKVLDIYKEYLIPQNLQEHMLRVASLASILLENWTGSRLDRDSIVKACVVHDIAKPTTFDLAKQAQFGMSPEAIKDLEKLQIRLKSNYGANEHEATVKICKEIGLPAKAVILVDNLEWSYIPRLLNDIESLIPIYCDMRISPKGILSMKTRLEDLKTRESGEDFEEKQENGQEIEKLISQNVSIDVNSISDSQINSNFEKLLNTEI